MALGTSLLMWLCACWQLSRAASLWQDAKWWQGDSSTSNTLSCPSGQQIAFGLTMSWDSYGSSTCTRSRYGKCSPRASSCSLSGCTATDSAVPVFNYIWIACDLPANIPSARTFLIANGNNNPVTASCPSSASSITFGITMGFSPNFDRNDYSCLVQNNDVCTPGLQTCSSSSCSGVATNEAVVFLVCDPPSAGTPYTLVSQAKSYYYQSSSGTSVTCPTGFSVAFGLRIQTTTSGSCCGSSSTSCLNGNNQECTSGLTTCSTSYCTTDTQYGGDISRSSVACQAMNCGALNIGNGTSTCVSNGYGPTSYLATCTASCNAGFTISGNTSVTCKVSGWTTSPKCIDNNECLVNNGGCDSRTSCFNLPGTFTCSPCPSPMAGNPLTGCFYPNLCTSGANPCGTNFQCFPNGGNYSCEPKYVYNSMVAKSGAIATGSIIKINSSTAPAVLAFTVTLTTPLVSMYVTYGPPLLTKNAYTAYSCLNNITLPASTLSYPRNITVNCTIQQPGVGWNLTFVLNWCVGSTTGTTTLIPGLSCGVSMTWGSVQRFQYLAPTITAKSLLIVGGQQGANIITNIDVNEVVLTGTNFLPDPNKLSVFYGTTGNPTLYGCAIYKTSSNSTALHCSTQQGSNGTNLTFSIQVFDGVIGGPTVVDSDHLTFQTGLPPSVSQITGCPTTGCPTAGNLQITLAGSSFVGRTITVLVNDRPCSVNPSTVTQNVIMCLLGEGVGQNAQVIVQAGTFLSLPYNNLLSFSLPSITSITSPNCTTVNDMQLINCARGGGVLTVRGNNFGHSGARVVVGATYALNTIPSPSTPHQLLTCSLPLAISGTSAVVVEQVSGGRSPSDNTAPLISFTPCPAGTYSQGPLCQSCPPGRFEQSTDSAECDFCPAGQYTTDVGQTHCSACIPGSYRDWVQVSALAQGQLAGNDQPTQVSLAVCKACPAGSFSDSFGSVLCDTCPVGRFGAISNQTTCTDCDAGTYAPNPGSLSCVACPAGKVAETSGLFACVDCLAGLYSANPGSKQCSTCPQGWYQAQLGQAKCLPCAAGYYQDQAGQKQCNLCDRGSFSNATQSLSCITCSPGSYQGVPGQTLCTACSPGTYQQNPGEMSCNKCESGRYTNSSGVIACQECEPGRVQSTTGQNACVDCDVGTSQSASGHDVCDACPVGTFSSATGATTCSNCPPGSFANTANSRTCQACPVGYAAPYNRTSDCVECEAGKFSVGGQATCTPCPGGSVQPETRAQSCDQCPPGTYAKSGSATCTACQANTVAPVEGTESCLQCNEAVANSIKTKCQCPAGTYADVQEQCQACPVGSVCLGVGVSYFDIQTQAGYWRPTAAATAANNSAPAAAPLSFYPCLRAQDCLGGLNSDCGGFRTGPLCGQCINGYRMSLSNCELCPAKSRAAIYAFLLVIAAVVGVVLVFTVVLYMEQNNGAEVSAKTHANFAIRTAQKYVDYERSSMWADLDASSKKSAGSKNSRAAGGGGGEKDKKSHDASFSGDLQPLEAQVQEAKSRANITFPLKILLSFFQIITTLSGLNNIPWPRTFLKFISVFTFLNIDFIPWQTLSCSVHQFTFYTKLVITTATPPGVFLLLFACFFIPSLIIDRRDMSDSNEHRDRRQRHRALFWKLVCFSLFLIYPLVSSTVLALYHCMAVGPTSYLVKDFTVVCYTPEWNRYAVFAGVMVVVYPIGLPLGFLLLLMRNRGRLYSNNYVKMSLGFFYESYVSQFWWFECVEMVHKLMLTSVLQFMPANVNLRFGLIVNCMYIVSTLVLSPYVRRSDDRLHMAAQAAIMNLMLASFVMHSVGQMSNLADILISAVLIAISVIVMFVVLLQVTIFIRKLVRLQKRLKLIKRHKELVARQGGVESSALELSVSNRKGQDYRLPSAASSEVV